MTILQQNPTAVIGAVKLRAERLEFRTNGHFAGMLVNRLP